MSREQVADAIAADMLRLPALPSDLPTIGAEPVYLRSRLAELLASTRSHGLEPDGFEVAAHPSMLEGFSSVRSVDGIPVTFTEMFEGHFDLSDPASFYITVSGLHPATVWIRSVLGFAFPGPVDPAYWHTRWVLQEHDGMSGGDASAAASAL